MTIAFTLNGREVQVQAGAERRLIDILRGNFHLTGAKAGCRAGRCGACVVLQGGEAVNACLIPAFRVRGTEITTIEGFSQRRGGACEDILQGFAEAGVENCGFCDAGKILITEALLSRESAPSREDILRAFQGIRCRCTDSDRLVAGVLAAQEKRRRRLYGRAS